VPSQCNFTSLASYDPTSDELNSQEKEVLEVLGYQLPHTTVYDSFEWMFFKCFEYMGADEYDILFTQCVTTMKAICYDNRHSLYSPEKLVAGVILAHLELSYGVVAVSAARKVAVLSRGRIRSVQERGEHETVRLSFAFAFAFRVLTF